MASKRKAPELDDVQRGITAKKLRGTAPELRNMIYKSLVDAEFPSDKSQREHPSVLEIGDNEEAHVVEATLKPGRYQLVGESGQPELVDSTLCKMDPLLFAECFSECTKDWTFAFAAPEHLKNFITRVQIILSIDTTLSFEPGCLELHLFANKKFQGMEGWQEMEMHHGYVQRAEKHFDAWMDAVQNLDSLGKFHVRFVFKRHWRDYDNLGGAAKIFRKTGLESSVWVDPQLVEDYPENDRDRHLALTVAAFKGQGLSWQNSLQQAEVTEMCDHGCRGLRQQKFED
ncbi:unnamed protein product [Zymoseptoria tritici ST99CH_1E4]|uniref:Uncharacterized protein n=1 Tax=Zymoseptoria tritici ST99CH_1E4 TaxID=1276532 RepID=A0A2H1GNH2_ZYMTR|nr:unnamed protein product [Zymoseptoria tritici ST99CH_1E4]